MRLVQYEDERGWLHQAYITEDMPISDAEKGLPNDPPDLDRLDWDTIKRDLNNLLVRRGLITQKDVDSCTMLSGTILSTIMPGLIQLYKEQPGYQKSPNQLSPNGQVNGQHSKEAH